MNQGLFNAATSVCEIHDTRLPHTMYCVDCGKELLHNVFTVSRELKACDCSWRCCHVGNKPHQPHIAYKLQGAMFVGLHPWNYTDATQTRV